MNENTNPVFYAALHRIHAVITRGLGVALENSQKFAETGFPDRQTYTGFIRYVQSLLIVLNAHRLTEEELAFPYFKERMPSLRTEPLITQHEQMLPHIGEMKAAIDQVTPDASAVEHLQKLAAACANLRILWLMHSTAEENYFAANSQSALELSDDEQDEITRRTAQYNQKYAEPGQWVVPFILYNLPPDERALMAKVMPPQVTKMLIPIVWKNEWAPMKPFLLD